MEVFTLLPFLLALLSSTLAVSFEECTNVAENTFIAVENNCRSYIYCAANAEESLQEDCPLDTYFDEIISECVVDEYGICPTNMEETAGHSEEVNTAEEEKEEEEKEEQIEGLEKEETGNENLAEKETENKDIITTVTVQPTMAANRPTCNHLEDSVHPHPVRCEYYYKCMRGYLTIFRCNFFYAWDYEKQICLPSQDVRCYGDSKIRRVY
ncbi:uncharacterized protein [Musca autumnalis]|uniref:uncharacterized protein n=1 Tax=Musca autumnalis TaxID=221902 RepID=UPI003CE9C550